MVKPRKIQNYLLKYRDEIFNLVCVLYIFLVSELRIFIYECILVVNLLSKLKIMLHGVTHTSILTKKIEEYFLKTELFQENEVCCLLGLYYVP